MEKRPRKLRRSSSQTRHITYATWLRGTQRLASEVLPYITPGQPTTLQAWVVDNETTDTHIRRPHGEAPLPPGAKWVSLWVVRRGPSMFLRQHTIAMLDDQLVNVDQTAEDMQLKTERGILWGTTLFIASSSSLVEPPSSPEVLA